MRESAGESALGNTTGDPTGRFPSSGPTVAEPGARANPLIPRTFCVEKRPAAARSASRTKDRGRGPPISAGLRPGLGGATIGPSHQHTQGAAQ